MPQETQYLTNAAECERLSIVRGTRQQLGGRGHLRSGLFSVEEYAARRECKVQPAIRSHYADGGQHQIYDARSDQFAPVIAHDSPLFPVLTFEGLCGGIRAARLISPQCGVAATPDPRSILSSATEHIGSPSRPFEPPPVRRRPFEWATMLVAATTRRRIDLDALGALASAAPASAGSRGR